MPVMPTAGRASTSLFAMPAVFHGLYWKPALIRCVSQENEFDAAVVRLGGVEGKSNGLECAPAAIMTGHVGWDEESSAFGGKPVDGDVAVRVDEEP